MMGYQLDFFYVDYPVELKSYFLGVGAKTTGLPTLWGSEQQRRSRVLLFVRTAGNYLEFQLTTHYNC